MDAGGLGVEVAQVNVSVLERMMTFLRPLAWIAHFNDNLRAPWRQVEAAVERHDFLDRSRAEVDAVVLFQITLDAEPAGIAVFLLQREDGVNCSEIDLAPRVVRSARQIDQ